jgi:hypothetical protein
VRTITDAEEDRALEIAPPINPRADWRVAIIQALPPNALRVRFNDGTEREVDVSKLIRAPHTGVFATLRKRRFSERSKKCGGISAPARRMRLAVTSRTSPPGPR